MVSFYQLLHWFSGQPPYSDKTEDEIKTFVKIGRKLSKPEECPSEM